MPTNTVNGWTGASLLPSYSTVASILGGAGRAATPTTPAASTTPAPGAPGTSSDPYAGNPFAGLLRAIYGNNPPGSAGGGAGGGTIGGGNQLPSVPSNNPPGWRGDAGAPPGLPNARGMPQLTPEQAYANYLTSLGGATNQTPMGNAIQDAQRATIQARVMDPFGYATQPNTLPVGAIGSFQASASPETWGAANYANNLNQNISRFSPYAFSYGTPAAAAPAPTPAWGYPSSYGTPAPGTVPGRGFGFG